MTLTPSTLTLSSTSPGTEGPLPWEGMGTGLMVNTVIYTSSSSSITGSLEVG